MSRPKRKEITQEEKVQAVLNVPELAQITFEMGNKEYPILDLPYDDYIQFLALLQPFLEAFTGQLAKAAGLGENNDAATPGSLIKYCAQTLPDMVQIIARQSVPEITTKDVKILCKTPFKMADIVIKQIDQNNLIGDIADFFVQILPLMKAGRKLTNQPTNSTAVTTL